MTVKNLLVIFGYKAFYHLGKVSVVCVAIATFIYATILDRYCIDSSVDLGDGT